tara:strand:+ start:133 stop:339 length:207 start_codon:yes stop_codon:yes gene_type:complete
MTNKANTTIQDLYSFKNMQIEALQNELFKAKKKITNLETFIFELCDKDCPNAYKDIVKKDVFNDTTRN